MTYNVFSGTLNPTHSLTHSGTTRTKCLNRVTNFNNDDTDDDSEDNNETTSAAAAATRFNNKW